MSPVQAMRTLGAAFTLAVLLAACGVPVQDTSRELERSEAMDVLISPTTAPAPTTTTTTVPPTTVALQPEQPPPVTPAPTVAGLPVALWFVRDDRLVSSPRLLDVGAGIGGLVALLRAGPDEGEREGSLRSAIPESEELVASSAGGVATVALSPTFAELPANDQLLAVGQIVGTLTSYPGVGQVRFTVNGEPISVVRGDGSSAPDAVSRDDYLSLLD
jgi:hypothetical protein